MTNPQIHVRDLRVKFTDSPAGVQQARARFTEPPQGELHVHPGPVFDFVKSIGENPGRDGLEYTYPRQAPVGHVYDILANAGQAAADTGAWSPDRWDYLGSVDSVEDFYRTRTDEHLLGDSPHVSVRLVDAADGRIAAYAGPAGLPA